MLTDTMAALRENYRSSRCARVQSRLPPLAWAHRDARNAMERSTAHTAMWSAAECTLADGGCRLYEVSERLKSMTHNRSFWARLSATTRPWKP